MKKTLFATFSIGLALFSISSYAAGYLNIKNYSQHNLLFTDIKNIHGSLSCVGDHSSTVIPSNGTLSCTAIHGSSKPGKMKVSFEIEGVAPSTVNYTFEKKGGGNGHQNPAYYKLKNPVYGGNKAEISQHYNVYEDGNQTVTMSVG